MNAREEQQAMAAANQQMQGQQQAQQAQKQQQEAEERANQKKMILKQLLDAEGLDRITRIALVKPEKVTALENFIIAKVQRGEITTKVTDDQLLQYMDEMEKVGAGSSSSKVRVQRKRNDDSDDDLDLEDD